MDTFKINLRMDPSTKRKSLPMMTIVFLLGLVSFTVSSEPAAAGCADIDIVCQQEVATKFAPLLRFDSQQGQSNKCFPGDAGSYYAQREREGKKCDKKEGCRICNRNYGDIQSGKIPTYYEYASCGDNEYVRYWFFYGWQDTCSPGLGSHDADWESVVVKIANGSRDRVMFFQHRGQYTRKPGRYEVYASTHPIVYVGKNSHGSYHDDGGTGTCCYYEDFRKPGRPNQKMQTWLNLVRLSKDEGSPEWMRYSGTTYWDGLPGPLFQSWNNNLCELQGCRGSRIKVCDTAGCFKSDIGDGRM